MSSREDRGRYRGRRRAPTPPRARYAAVVTTAFVGAGVVALGTAAAMPDSKDGPALSASSASVGADDLAARLANADRANRSSDRDADLLSSIDQAMPDVWMLPVDHYTISSQFGTRSGSVHRGVDLSVPEGTPYYAAHSGVVKLARYNGGYGYCVEIDTGNDVTLVYGHASKLLVHEGQQVQAGDVLGLTGDTGYSFAPQLHFEVRVKDAPTDPIPFMQAHGVDIPQLSQPAGN